MRRGGGGVDPSVDATVGMRSGAAARVLVVEPRETGLHDLGTAAALARLGPEARAETVHDGAVLRARLAKAPYDLVVVDQALGAEALAIAGTLRETGPPVVFVCRDPDEGAALEALRRGAADCVVASADYLEVLPVVALEQIRRWRAARERSETERRLRWLERLPEVVVEAIPTALAVLDPQRAIVTANPAFGRLVGASPEAMRGEALSAVLPAVLSTGGVEEALRAAEHGGGARPSLVRVGEGPERAYDVRAARIGEGRLLLLLSEVTEVEALLRQFGELRRYHENVIQNLNSALVVVDREGRVTYANPTAEAVLGAEAGSMDGQSIFAWFPERERDELVVRRTLSTGARFRGAEAVAARPDGRLVPIGISCAPLVDEKGDRQGAVAIFQDLSEIKQLQRQVLQTEKLASIGQLAAGVAHEINNPMGFVHANLYQLSEYLGDLGRVWERVEGLRKAVAAWPRVPARLRAAAAELDAVIEEVEASFLLDDMGKAVHESLEGSERIRHIVQDLRAFSYQDTAERTLADVNKALDSTANIVWTMMKHSVVLTKQYEELPPVLCYPMQLKQVFMNLLVNAYQAIEERLAAEGGRAEIRLRTRCRDGGVAIEVSDNGSGIEPALQDRIFDPFFTTKEVGVGTGLGLSTSYQLVKRHGGSLSVRSERGRGATFEVWLPLDEDDAGSAV
jgi:PAS domain S-box-containing protein